MMPNRSVHHLVDIVVILQGGLAGLRQSHWLDEAVMMMIVVFGSLIISGF
jgi:hypothetical protein